MPNLMILEHAPNPECEYLKTEQGCFWCCKRCNYDRHQCPMCGDHTGHITTVHPACAKEAKRDRMNEDLDKPPSRIEFNYLNNKLAETDAVVSRLVVLNAALAVALLVVLLVALI